MRLVFTLCLLLAVSSASYSQSYNSPESVEYDALHQRYIVANTSANNLQQVIPGSAPTLFVSSVPSPYGIAIVGDTVYVCCNSTHLRGYNLTTGTQAFDVNLGGTFLNGICSDEAGNLFVTDFSAKKVVRYNIATQQFNYFVGTAMAKIPNGIVFDKFHNRLAIASWGTNAPILGLSLSDSTISTLKATSLSNIDGLSIDEDGNFYAADWGSDGIYFFDSAFANAPVKIVNGLNRPADISYTQLKDTLAVPNTMGNTVTFYGFPRPVAVNDSYNATVGVQATICVLQNDHISGNAPLLLQSFSGNALGTAAISNNCLNYTASASGNDTITYVVCSVDTPSFCRSAKLFITNAAGGANLAPVATNDIATTTQPNGITINVVTNDNDPNSDPLCITSIAGSPAFAIDGSNCQNIIFTPDSSFTGNDTCYYVVCDNGAPQLCDTASLVVTVNACILNDFALAAFCSDGSAITPQGCPWCLKMVAQGAPGANVEWHVLEYWNSIPDTTVQGNDTLTMSIPNGCLDAELQLPYNFDWIVCATIQNTCGSITHCDTVKTFWEGIENVALTGVEIYPNPAVNNVTIDMRDASINSYAAIEIIDATGALVKTISDSGKKVEVHLDNLPAGIYLASLVSKEDGRKLLGRFTISR